MVVYSLIADLFLFDETFVVAQMFGAALVLLLNFIVMYDSYKRSNI